MKNPLSYQSTEYDCGPVTLINAINFLFDREEIPPEIIKTITLYCLDGYGEMGEAGKSGTSAFAMVFISNWLNQYARMKRFPIYTTILPAEEIHMDQSSHIAECLQQGGAAMVRVILEGGHYVLLTGIDEEYVYLFDPYYDEVQYPDGIEIIENEPKYANRRVLLDIFNSEGVGDYAFGPAASRECMLLYNSHTRKTEEEYIEYFI